MNMNTRATGTARSRCGLLLLSLGLILFGHGSGRTAAPSGSERSAPKALTEVVEKHIGAHYAHLEALYKHFHTHPELSLQEAQTSARLARELKEIGFEVKEGVGGHGLVGVLKNGTGPTVLI